MNIKGKVLSVQDTQEVGVSRFKKRTFFLDRTRKEQYGDREFPNFAEITLLGDKVSLADNIAKGDVVDCSIDINGRFSVRENEEKFAQDIVCWKISVISKVVPPVAPTAPEPTTDII